MYNHTHAYVCEHTHTCSPARRSPPPRDPPLPQTHDCGCCPRLAPMTPPLIAAAAQQQESSACPPFAHSLPHSPVLQPLLGRPHIHPQLTHHFRDVTCCRPACCCDCCCSCCCDLTRCWSCCCCCVHGQHCLLDARSLAETLLLLRLVNAASHPHRNRGSHCGCPRSPAHYANAVLGLDPALQSCRCFCVVHGRHAPVTAGKELPHCPAHAPSPGACHSHLQSHSLAPERMTPDLSCGHDLRLWLQLRLQYGQRGQELRTLLQQSGGRVGGQLRTLALHPLQRAH
eukprot:scaffold73280_cov21-Tisochrysis_lutea.AAC.5